MTVGLSPFGELFAARIEAFLFGLSLIWSEIGYWRVIGAPIQVARTAAGSPDTISMEG